MKLTHQAAKTVVNLVDSFAKERHDDTETFDKILWTLLWARARALKEATLQVTNGRVLGGPFAGMKLTDAAKRLWHPPVILGCYEHELHPVVEDIVRGNYNRILNIGSSAGYYAVGFALRLPHVTIDAFDIDDAARSACVEMTRLNQVEDRVQVNSLFRGEDFAQYSGKKTIALVDIEGSEDELLDPHQYPALTGMDILVEIHDVYKPDLSTRLAQRFTATHDVHIIQNKNVLADLRPLYPPNAYIDPMDEFLGAWEGRDGPTPWGWFRAKK